MEHVQTNSMMYVMGALIIGAVIYSSRKTVDKNEHFTNEKDTPVFLNLYPQDLSTDFELFDIIQRFRYQIESPRSQNLAPILFVPGLGSCPVFAKWNKPSTKNIKQVVDRDFQMNTDWSCRQVQTYWTELWYPKKYIADKLSRDCWKDNIDIHYDRSFNTLKNAEGVMTKSSSEIEHYMLGMIDSLKSLGYEVEKNLYIESYDFRKICAHDEISQFCEKIRLCVETNCQRSGKKAILVGHDIGSCLLNYFLVKMSKEWKSKYVEEFVTFSGGFGGCPQALRSLLFDDNHIGNFVQKCTGLQLLLPNPVIWGDHPLFEYNKVIYTSKTIPDLLHAMDVPGEVIDIYKNITYPFQMECMKAPDVKVYSFVGKGVDTEVRYVYDNYLKVYKDGDGDGIIPSLALDTPMKWTSFQEEPVYYNKYPNVQHRAILSNRFSVKDLMSVVTSLY